MARKESQNPGAPTAQGSKTSTAHRLSISTVQPETKRPLKSAPAAASSITTARCVGTSMPERSA